MRPAVDHRSTVVVGVTSRVPVGPDLQRCLASVGAQTLEDMAEALCYVKNQNLGFLIPYTISGDQRNYVPDFIARIDDGRGPDDPLNLIIEVTGARDKDKAAKVAAARNLWVPAVNNAGMWGRWAFVEIADPWEAKNRIRSFEER